MNSCTFDFSKLQDLPNIDETKNHPNIGSPNMTVFCGSTGSGKTHLLFKCLLTEGFFDYDELYILSATSESKQYKFLKYCFEKNINKDIILSFFLNAINKFTIEQLYNLIDKLIADNEITNAGRKNFIKIVISNQIEKFPTIEEFEKSKNNKLIIADDIIGNNDYNDLMEIYFTRGRHCNISCIYLSQNFTSIPTTIRRNLSNLFLFKTSGRNLGFVYSEVAQSFYNKQDFMLMCNRTWENQYSYVFINKINRKVTNDVFK